MYFLTGFAAHGVCLRTNLNRESTIFAGVGSSHFSSSVTIHCCKLERSL